MPLNRTSVAAALAASYDPIMTQTKIELIDVELSEHCTALLGAQSGKYPDANGMLVRGSEKSALIDLTLGIAARRESFAADRFDPPVPLPRRSLRRIGKLSRCRVLDS